MIEINLLPGDAKKKKRGKATTGSGFKMEIHPGRWFAGLSDKITDKYMLGAIGAAGAAGAKSVAMADTLVKKGAAANATAADSAAQASKSPRQRQLERDRAKRARSDSLLADARQLSFKVVGHTVDIQALTRFMKSLEASPFIQNVQLTRSDLVQAEGKEVTEFTLLSETQAPPPFVTKTVPLVLSAVR